MTELREKEKLLLRLLFSEETFEEKHMDILLPEPSIDDERIEYLMMLSIQGTRSKWKYFPEWVKPRLRGIYRYFRVEDIEGLPWLREKIALLENEGIPAMLLKGAAMRARYAADSPRQMSDFDVAVPEKHFDQAIRIFLEAGCVDTAVGAALHAKTFHDGEYTLDLHRWIFKTHGEKNSDLWENAEQIEFNRNHILVPQPVDMIVHVLDSRAHDVIVDNTMERRMKWLFDVRSVLEVSENVSWRMISDRAREMGRLPYLKLILPQFAEVFPEKLSVEELNQYFPDDDDYFRWKAKADHYKRVSERLHLTVKKRGENIYTADMAMKELHYLWTGWRCCYGPELRAAGEKMSFIRYLCYSLGTDSVPGLFRKYLPVLWKFKEEYMTNQEQRERE